jgi:acid stress-induced BolA-like protein IbaG/YrbA
MSSITINTSNTTAATFRKKSTHRLPSFRLFSSERTSAEISMEKALQTKLKTIHVQVQDVSNGCGSMYDIQVVSSDFQGQTRVKQHRMVNEVSERK